MPNVPPERLAGDPAPPGSPETDEEVERAWRGGRRAAMAELFRRHYGGVVRYVSRLLADPAGAEDVTQQAFVRLLERRRGQGRFRALVYTVARNLALNELRRRGKRHAGRPLEADVPATAPSPPEVTARQEEAAALAAALAALPPDEREALRLKEACGLTYPEVGAALGLHPDAARRRVARALGRLRAALPAAHARSAAGAWATS